MTSIQIHASRYIRHGLAVRPSNVQPAVYCAAVVCDLNCVPNSSQCQASASCVLDNNQPKCQYTYSTDHTICGNGKECINSVCTGELSPGNVIGEGIGMEIGIYLLLSHSHRPGWCSRCADHVALYHFFPDIFKMRDVVVI